MKIVANVIWTSAAIQIFAPGAVATLAPHMGHAAADESVSSWPHFTHFWMDTIRARLHHAPEPPTIDQGNGTSASSLQT